MPTLTYLSSGRRLPPRTLPQLRSQRARDQRLPGVIQTPQRRRRHAEAQDQGPSSTSRITGLASRTAASFSRGNSKSAAPIPPVSCNYNRSPQIPPRPPRPRRADGSYIRKEAINPPPRHRRPVTSDEAQSFTHHVRRITAILALHGKLDAHYGAGV